jgi:xanthine dehydrogenase YagR molybdenum-binding subunit
VKRRKARDVDVRIGFKEDSRVVKVTIPDDLPIPWSLEDKLRIVGKPLPRVNASEVVTGRAKYTTDVSHPGMLHAKTVRSPHAHARVKSIDSTEAGALPGVRHVEKFEGREVKFAGEEVAIVVADTPEIAEDAAGRLQVEYEILPHVLTIEEAMKEDAPRVHGDRPNVQGGRERPNRQVEAGLREADHVLERTYVTEVQTHTCLEPHGSVARWDGENVTVWNGTQSVQGARGELARFLRIPATRARVIVEYLGGGFGSKFGLQRHGGMAARLAQILGQPVKYIYSRDEDHLATGNRPSSIQSVKAGVKRDGRITAWEVTSFGSGGVAGGGGVANPMIYDFGAQARSHSDVFTNAGPAAPMRAPGHPQGSFAIESMMDELAETIGMDPLEFRKKNDRNALRLWEYDAGAKAIGWHRRPKTGSEKGAVRRGMGIAAARWGGMGGPNAQIEMSFYRDGSIELLTGCQDVGSGTRSIAAMISAEDLGVDPKGINVRIGDSSLPPGPGSGGSTTAPSVMPAVRDAAWQLARKIRELAAAELGAEADDIELGDGQARSKSKRKSVSYAKLGARVDGEKITVRGTRRNDFAAYQNGVAGAQFAEVEVDTETGIVRVVRFVAVQDCGRIVNRALAENQIAGAVVQGIGYALFEERILDPKTGNMLNADLLFYKLPGPKEVPDIEVLMPDVNNGGNTVSVVGLGEPPSVAVAAAIANAVANALGRRVYSLPITPAKVLAALGVK